MSEITLSTPARTNDVTHSLLKGSVKTWFVTAAVGHWIFLTYILAVFYPPLANEGLQGLEGLHLPSGFRAGEPFGNLAAASHVLLAALIIGGGPLQLIPAVRARFPVFHRWLGRSYLICAVISAAAGLYLVWTRNSVGNLVNDIGISIDGVLILVFAFMAVRFALARKIQQHRRWALRLFMAASAVWFFRVGLMGWAALTGGAGMDFETFTGPAIYALTFAQYLLPLLMLEWYFRCQKIADTGERLMFVGALSVLTLYMGIGIFMATMGMWLPRM